MEATNSVHNLWKLPSTQHYDYQLNGYEVQKPPQNLVFTKLNDELPLSLSFKLEMQLDHNDSVHSMKLINKIKGVSKVILRFRVFCTQTNKEIR